ncbi:hypothetical protein ACROYT_G042979 [Oculina patagonica]
MKASALLLISFTCLGRLSLAKEGKYNEAEQALPSQEWLDPWDMIHYDATVQSLDRTGFTSGSAKETMHKQSDYERLQAKLSQCHKDLEQSPVQCQACAEKTNANASPCDTPYFKKIVRSILGNLEERGDHDIVVTASKDDVATLEKFVKSDDGNVQDVCEVVIGIVSNFKGKDDLYDFSQWDNSTLSYVTKEAILIFASLILVMCAAIVFETRTKLTWRTQLWGVLFLCFIVSIPWEWFHLYRKAFAAKQAKMEKDIPKECRSDHELRPLESLMLWFRNSFTFSDDRCVKYQEMLLVDPIWEISPSKAISATVASIIAQPFEHIAEAIGKSFRALFREVPIQWQPFVFMAVIIIIIIAMFTLSGLQVRLPFMTITTVPALPINFQGNLQRLENHVENVQAAIQQLNNDARQRDAIDHAPQQENINNQQEQILELLNAMNERQQRWEETMRRAEPAIQGGNQPVEGALGPVEGGVNRVGAEEERPPERLPVMESPKLKVPVQSTDTDTKLGVEDVGSSEHP